MKSINDLYQEVKSDEELRNKLFAAYGKGEIEGFLNDNECDATFEEAQKFIEQELRSGSHELSDEELALVVGGKNEKPPAPKYSVGDYVKLRIEVAFGYRILAGTIQAVGDYLNKYYGYRYRIRSSSENPLGEGIEADIVETDIEGIVGQLKL